MSEEEKAELEELYENSEWWHNRFKAVQRDYENLQQKIDTATEFLEIFRGTDFPLLQGDILNLLEILGDKE